MSLDTLFTPFELKSIKSRNRVAMAPMTRSKSPNGKPTEEVAEYYARRAKHNVGLIITEGTVINRPSSRTDPDIPSFYEESKTDWAHVAKRVHEEGGQIIPQIWHVGNVRRRANYEVPLPIDSPSGLIMPDDKNAEPMSEEAIADTIAQFAISAKMAKDIGFDGIELHGAHGYLIDQFFWDGLNKRTDKWGGATITERNLFATETIKACRAAVGEDFAICIRVSQWKQQDYEARIANSPDEMNEWLGGLINAGADILHCSQRRIETPEFEGSDLNFAGWAKKLTGAPTISVGSVGLDGDFLNAFRGQGADTASLDTVLKQLENNEYDMVAVGRALLANPDWVDLIKSGETTKPFAKEYLGKLY